MFDLVNDVERYPARFGWCASAEVLEDRDDLRVARLGLRFAGATATFTTRNELERPTRIGLELVDGPFRALRGQWWFQPLGDAGCKVMLDLDFEMNGGLVGTALAIGFHKLADHLVEEFVRAAQALP
jgi:ribosome-associated toxin RatA of RatAB toxin-antitoxin module